MWNLSDRLRQSLRTIGWLTKIAADIPPTHAKGLLMPLGKSRLQEMPRVQTKKGVVIQEMKDKLVTKISAIETIAVRA